MDIIKFDGEIMPAPSKFKIPQFDLDSADTKRNELGYLQRDRIRQGVFKVEVEWKYLTDLESQKILNAIKPSSIQVTFPTPFGIQTKTMYAGDRNVDSILYKTNANSWNISFNLIEV